MTDSGNVPLIKLTPKVMRPINRPARSSTPALRPLVCRQMR